MKLQDLYPFDSALVGLNDLYIPLGRDGFYINVQNIIAKDCTITTGRTYLLLTHFNDDLKAKHVKLEDVFYDNRYVHIILKDNAGLKSAIVHDFNSANVHKWWLIDFEYLQSISDEAIAREYCGC